VKHARIAGRGKASALSEMCGAPDVGVGGYRAWKRGGAPDRKRLADNRMPALIRVIHAGLKGAHGCPRMVREPRTRGFSAGERRAGRPVRDNGIHARHKRRYKVTTDSKHGLQPARQKLHAGGAGPGPDVGYPLPVDRWGLALPGGRARPVQPGSCRPAAEAADGRRVRGRRAGHGPVRGAPATRPAPGSRRLPSSASRSSTTGNGSIRPPVTSRPFSSWRTGSARDSRKNR